MGDDPAATVAKIVFIVLPTLAFIGFLLFMVISLVRAFTLRPGDHAEATPEEVARWENERADREYDRRTAEIARENQRAWKREQRYGGTPSFDPGSPSRIRTDWSDPGFHNH